MTLRDLFSALLVFPIAVSALFAGEPPTAKPPVRFDDAKLAIKVKSAFSADRELGGINLFVSVLDGVVVVQGPVANDTIRDRIKTLTAAVPGVSAVKVDCFVVGEEDPLKREIASRLTPVPKTEARPATPLTAQVATGTLPSIAVGPPVLAISSPPLSDDLPSRSGTESTVTVQRPAEPAGPMIEGGLLSAPVSAVATTKSLTVTPLPDAPATPRPYPTIPSPHVPILPVGMKATSPEEVAFALVELRKSDPRFAGLQATLSNGVVTISGKAEPDSIDAFLTATRQIAGVMRVEFR